MLFKKGLHLGIIANIIWGSSFLASKITLKVWGPLTSSAIRFAIALIGMLIIFPLFGFAIKRPNSSNQWKQIIVIAISGFGLLYPLQLTGMKWIPTSISASIMLTSPIFVVIFSSIYFAEKLSKQKVFAILLGLIGGIILIGPAHFIENEWTAEYVLQFLKGSLLTIIASACLALSVVATRPLAKEMDSKSITFWSMLLGELIILPFAFFEPAVINGPQVTLEAVLAMLFLALICSVAAFIIWNQAITKSTPQEIASTMHIKTPVAVIIGIAIAHEPLTLTIVTGSLLISFAVWSSQAKFKLQGVK